MEVSARRFSFWLILLVAALALVSALALLAPASREVPRPAPAQPRLTPERMIGSGAPVSSHLVSYTDDGFESPEIAVRRGEVVTFTNNSTHDMRIIPVEVPLQLRSATCGSEAAFDTCNALPPGEYWEFAFDIPGIWRYADKSSGKEGVIRVQ